VFNSGPLIAGQPSYRIDFDSSVNVVPESRLVILMASDLLLLGVGNFLTLTPQLPVRPDDLDNCAPPP